MTKVLQYSQSDQPKYTAQYTRYPTQVLPQEAVNRSFQKQNKIRLTQARSGSNTVPSVMVVASLFETSLNVLSGIRMYVLKQSLTHRPSC